MEFRRRYSAKGTIKSSTHITHACMIITGGAS
ncbi:hypothetical protein COLO4_12496 [Corchorus olitorius]|uniref:Uncharacterized protein n=1 Tax=Corchorus olitorius TaxID=93759 RepID=A0A1R3K0P6_9ROSI|nr:hypothetical protein COLO4_12496 [Corchorus olitorius]